MPAFWRLAREAKLRELIINTVQLSSLAYSYTSQEAMQTNKGTTVHAAVVFNLQPCYLCESVGQRIAQHGFGLCFYGDTHVFGSLKIAV